MNLPERIFVTGVIGSKWSAITHELEKLNGVNTSDHSSTREYEPIHMAGYAPDKFTSRPMHRGVYFGKGMEFEPYLAPEYLDSAWTVKGGTKIIKSHDWSTKLDTIREVFPSDWLMLIYRPDSASLAWWYQHGGPKITYPNYSAIKNHAEAQAQIAIQNDLMLKFAHLHNLKWGYFNEQWILENFGQKITITRPWNQWDDVLVTLLKPDA
jgi:hypothetical protein